jgi:hypothetical protein
MSSVGGTPAGGSNGSLKVTATHRPGALAQSNWPRCARCHKRVRPDRLVKGFGRDCAEFLGLVGSTVDTGQGGPDLFDVLAEQARETASARR